MVWARRSARATECPKSSVSAASLGFLEKFQAWKAGGCLNLLNLPSRDAQAVLLLEPEWKKELSYANGRDS